MIAVLAALLAAAVACTINPVTGDRELALVSAAEEVAIGEAQYMPSRQMQGGEYVRDPALTEYVNGIGQRLADVSERALPYEFVVLNNSVPNAWALPGGKIAVNRGLLTELDSEAELAAVIGHEIVHAAARHGALAMQRGLLIQGALVVTAVATRSDDYSGMAIGAASLGAQLINSRYGRQAELESDRYGMQYMARAGYDPQAAVSLQETFLRLSEGRGDQGWVAGLFASHPPSAERVERNRRTAAELPAGGELGRERYQAAVAGLTAAEPAYAAYDRGRRALAEGDLDAAAEAAAEAVRRVGDEAHFYALLGDIERARRNDDAAVTHYRRALELNEDYFNYHLGLGRALMGLRQYDRAQTAFEASLALLPTADALLGLGQIAENRGDRSRALEQYRRAAEGGGDAGTAAREAVVRLDLPSNPGQYLALSGSLDGNGQLVLTIGNPTGQAIRNIGLVARFPDAAGQPGQVSRTITDTLPAGASRQFATGIGPLASLESVQVQLISATIVQD
jgi:predicted Zn-dependent protease